MKNKTIVKTIKTVSAIAGGLVVLGAFFWLVLYSIDKQEVVECYKWQRYEEQYPLFEISTTTAKRCADIGVEIK